MTSPQPARDALAVAPAHWGRSPLKHLADINASTLTEETDPSFQFRYIDISSVDPLLGAKPSELTTFGEAPSRARRLVRTGDVLVSTVRTYLRAIAPAPASNDTLVASTGFAVVSPRSGIHPDFLRWWLQSSPFVEDVVARSQGVSYPATTASEVGNIYAPLPSVEEQHRISAFLTRECSGIDLLAREQRHQVELLVEHLQAAEDDLIARLGPANWSFHDLTVLPRLKHRVERVTVGIVITPSKWYTSEGVPALRGLNVRPGEVTNNNLVQITDEGNGEHAKSQLSDGDVVVVRTGNAGAAAVVPDWAIGGNAIDLLLVRPGKLVQPRYLELLLNSRLVRDQVTRGSVGALQAHFNTSALKNVRVIVPSLAEQQAAVVAADEVRASVLAIRRELESQSRVLAERRQALVTAAVTGQIELTEEAA